MVSAMHCDVGVGVLKVQSSSRHSFYLFGEVILGVTSVTQSARTILVFP